MRSGLTSHLNWATVQQEEPWWQEGDGEGGRADGRRWLDVHRSAPVCRCEGRNGVYPGIQIATQSFVGNDAFRRSAAAEASMFIVRILQYNSIQYNEGI